MPNLNEVNRQGLITWGGEDSTDYGIVVGESPVFDKPKRKQTVFNVPGRNGSVLFQQNAFDDVSRSYAIWIAEQTGEDPVGLPEIVSGVTAWLNSKTGYQRLEDSFEPDVYRLAYYTGGNNISDELLQYGEATLTFTCRPERFLKSGETEQTVEDGDILTNPTRFVSKPLIYIEASGGVTISIGGSSITAAVSDYIYIDCERMNAYRLPNENMNHNISGIFPNLAPGENAVSIAGTPTLVKITPNYFTI